MQFFITINHRKFNKIFITFNFLILLFLFNYIISIKLKNSVENKNTNKNKEKNTNLMKTGLPKDVESIPVLNVKLEEPDRETSVLKVYNGERKMERDRLRDLETKFLAQKRRFSNIIMMQNLQIAALSNIATANLKMLNKMSHKKDEKESKLESNSKKE